MINFLPLVLLASLNSSNLNIKTFEIQLYIHVHTYLDGILLYNTLLTALAFCMANYLQQEYIIKCTLTNNYCV